MKVEQLDHLVLPVSDIESIAHFYTTHLGMEKRTFGEGRVALHFGDQKINLHPAGWDYEPKAKVSVAGTADLCFLVSEPVESLQADLIEGEIEVIEGLEQLRALWLGLPIAVAGACEKPSRHVETAADLEAVRQEPEDR